uniref:Uncharacterized protein n=1 Tax=Arundo donax TaxID=35708 RepID=A0A0A9FBM7_ARUDO
MGQSGEERGRGGRRRGRRGGGRREEAAAARPHGCCCCGGEPHRGLTIHMASSGEGHGRKAKKLAGG